MRLVLRFPFLALAALTLVVGGAWHAAHVSPATRYGHALTVFASVLGAPFIVAQRVASSALGPGVVARVAGFLLGVMPYVLCELALMALRARGRSAPRGASNSRG